MSGNEEGGPAATPPVVAASVRDLGATPTPQSPSAAQRLRIHVPMVKTTVTLGAKAPGAARRAEDSGEPNYPGFGVDTEDGHVYIDAHGAPEKTKMTLQSNGYMHLQSDTGSMYLISNGSNVLATPKVANIVGGSGVVIGAGPWASPPTNLRSEGTDAGPNPPESVKELPEHLETVAHWWSGVDATMAAIAIAGTVLQTRFANPTSKAALAWASAKNLANLAAAGCVANNVWGIVTGGDIVPGAVTIHGTSGLIAGTPAWAGVYGGLGLTLGSTFPTMVGLIEAAIISSHKASITARKEITVTGGQELTLLAGHKVEIASKHHGIALKAHKIAVGSKSAAGGQAMTESVGIFGEKSVGLASKEHMRLSAEHFGVSTKHGVINSEKMVIGGEEKVAINSKTVALKGKEAISISTDKFMMNIDGSSFKMGNVESKIDDPPTRKPPNYDERIKLLASDTPMADLRDLLNDEEKSWNDEQMAWADKAGALGFKNCSIELKDGDITFKVHDFEFKVDSSQTAIGGALKIMKA